MTEKIIENKNLKDMTISDFFTAIQKQKGISCIWEKVLLMLMEMKKLPETSAGLKVLCIYFSLLDDGNTCVILDENKLLEKWLKKWNGLLLAAANNSDEKNTSNTLNFTEEEFIEVIKSGINEIETGKIFELVDFDNNAELKGLEKSLNVKKPFVVRLINGEKWLYAEKYYDAKIGIEKRIEKLFPAPQKNSDFETECKKVIEYFKFYTFNKRQGKAIELNNEQAQAIVLGKENNLILTGGPGTGKTTAVCYLLFELMKLKDEKGKSYCDYNLYLAAPSGKAAERMKESISGSLNDFLPQLISENKNIVQKLTVTDSSTIHRLLSFNPASNDFIFNRNNQFDKDSIFVIDESSMIDIHLFKCLLEAIPDGARVFILGDKDQLPSVQAGAVLGELLAKRENSKVELIISNRFNEKSQVGRLKNEFQKSEEFNDMTQFGSWLNSTENFVFARSGSNVKISDDKNPVFFYELKTADKENKIPSKKEQVNSVASKWCSVFCEDIVSCAIFENKNSLTMEAVKKLWNLSVEAKILCAEREGIIGVEGFNQTISELVCSSKKIKKDDDGYFTGELLIMTKNQKMFRLYNGDTGVVVSFKDDKLKYFMVEKKASENEFDSIDKSGIFRFGDFLFYPLYILPKDSLETAYAITIHKSQGSGYKNILVVFPEQEGHPLLNRQIAYTAITRTEGNTYIIASKKALNYAKKTVLTRDTNIEI